MNAMATFTYSKTRISALTNVGKALHRGDAILRYSQEGWKSLATWNLQGQSIRSIVMAKNISLMWKKEKQKSVYAQSTLNTLGTRHPKIIYSSLLAIV